MKSLWKITCEEAEYPGLWQLWFKKQSVAVGWASAKGYKLQASHATSSGWNRARKAIQEMAVGDLVIVTLRGNCVGRIGEITGKAIEDYQWDPLVPKSSVSPYGEKGRQIFVRWDLECGPINSDLIVQFPTDFRFSSNELRPTVAKVRSHSLKEIKDVMGDPKNWIGLLGKFSQEKSLSDYISSYPHHLEDGLVPHPNFPRIRELIFKDKTRLDVLLMDKHNCPVIVECKQNSPSRDDIEQLRGYIENLRQHDSNKRIRGILLHGGAQKLMKEIISYARMKPEIEIVSYRMRVDFTSSFTG